MVKISLHKSLKSRYSNQSPNGAILLSMSGVKSSEVKFYLENVSDILGTEKISALFYWGKDEKWHFFKGVKQFTFSKVKIQAILINIVCFMSFGLHADVFELPIVW